MLLVVALSILSCQDLEVTNQNAPDEERSLATPENVEALVSGSFLSWWAALHYSAPSSALITTADALSCSWGNWGMQDLSSEPRAAFRNFLTYVYREVVNVPWYGLYGAISSASDGIKAINGGIQIGANGANNPRALAFAKFVQGIGHGYVALIFDKGYILDETVDVNKDVLQLKPYNEVMAEAIKRLEETITLCQANNFKLPNTWINGLELTSAELAQVANSYIARFRAQVARTATERGQVDWAKVMAHVDQGITKNFAPEGNGAFNDWWHSVQWYGSQGEGSWHRVDYKLIGPSDKSTGYQNWLSKQPADRTEFEIDTDDKRIWNGTRATNGRQNPGKYFKYEATGSPFPPDRGLYHYSRYGWDRYQSYITNSGRGPMPIFLTTELDLFKAEGLLWTNGDLNMVATLINKTRVTNGEYPPATAADGLGSVTDVRSPFANSSLWAKLKYEKGLECLGTGSGIDFFDRRGWNELVTDSPIHLPVPAKELQVTNQGVYTFGGGGPGSAPKRSRPSPFERPH
ncbi:hypothetical protein L0337_15500 [candidate division KSB1 bacterium]|nr:hypothetical protein [candidate division KSB1 bacterium]